MRVIFYREPHNNSVLAVFPDVIENRHGNMCCYSHVGQHSSCSPGYLKKCKPAEPDEYQDLKRELEGIGYTLKIVCHIPFRRRQTAKRQSVKGSFVEALSGVWLDEQPEVVKQTLKQYV